MEEELLQFVWKMGLFDQNHLRTTDGDALEIIHRGLLNRGAGPDFSNAKIRINGTLWYGHIEIHVHADEWYKHTHHKDPAYNNTILHVVMVNNQSVRREDGSFLPCFCLDGKITSQITELYHQLKFNPAEIPCSGFLQGIRQTEIRQALDRALVSRLEQRSEWISEWLKQSTGDWHSVFMASLIRSFGFGYNSEAFELLARMVPVNWLCRNAHDRSTIEALLFGCAGFLEKSSNDEYQTQLIQEWQYLVKKYHLSQMDSSAFTHLRMRPVNFPEIRLAQLSAILVNFQQLLNHCIHQADINELVIMLRKSPDLYWLKHYQFGKISKRLNGPLSVASAQVVIINAIIPFLFYYGKYTGNEPFCDRALEMLQCLPGEKNHIVSAWQELGITSYSAYESQALIELKKNNCDKRKCLQCPIGTAVLRPTPE